MAVTQSTSSTATELPPTEEPSGGAPIERRVKALEAQLRDVERLVENNRLIRDTWTLIIFAIAAAALLVSVIAVGFGMRAIDEADQGAAPAPHAAPPHEEESHA